MAVGTLIGIATGFFGGWFDLVVQRVIDALMSIPTLLLTLVVVVFLGLGTINVIIALAIVSTPGISRIVRASAITESHRDYIAAAAALGASTPRILFRHLLPNVIPTVIVLVTINFGEAILAEASLSFLGMGSQPPTPSWGLMLSRAGLSYFLDRPMLAIMPGF